MRDKLELMLPYLELNKFKCGIIITGNIDTPEEIQGIGVIEEYK